MISIEKYNIWADNNVKQKLIFSVLICPKLFNFLIEKNYYFKWIKWNIII